MQSPEKIPVLKTVSLGVTYVLSHVLQIALMLLQAAIIVIGAYFLFETILGPDLSEELLEPVIGLALCPIAVAIHRDILLGEPIGAASYFPSFATGRVWKFWGFGILASVCAAVIVVLGSLIFSGLLRAFLPPMTLMADFILLFSFLIVASLLIARFVFVLPAVATDQFSGIWDAKNMLSGNYWRVMGALPIVGVVAAILNISLLFIDSGIIGLPASLSQIAIYLIAIAIALAALVGPATLSFAYSKVLSRQSHSASSVAGIRG